MNTNQKIETYKNNTLKLKYLIVVFFIIGLQSCIPTQDIDYPNTLTSDQNPTIFTDTQVTPADYQYSDKENFKVLSWNVEHFVDDFDDPYIDSTRENNPEPDMKDKVAFLTEALRSENADIVVLQEFESTKFLRKIAEDHLAGMGYKFFASAPSDGWYMNVVVMSKFPLGILYSYGNVTTPVIGYKDEDGLSETQNNINTRMWSLEVFPAEDYEFILTGLHLKAGRGERNESMRLGQINFLKHQFSRFLKMNASQNLLVVGDLNSLLGSTEIETLRSGNTEGNIFFDPLPDEIMTHPVGDPSRRLDYILFNSNMQKEYVPGSALVPNLLNTEKLKVLSDHLPLKITFIKDDQ